MLKKWKTKAGALVILLALVTASLCSGAGCKGLPPMGKLYAEFDGVDIHFTCKGSGKQCFLGQGEIKVRVIF